MEIIRQEEGRRGGGKVRSAEDIAGNGGALSMKENMVD
jgi:hypothetical protein